MGHKMNHTTIIDHFQINVGYFYYIKVYYFHA